MAYGLGNRCSIQLSYEGFEGLHDNRIMTILHPPSKGVLSIE